MPLLARRVTSDAIWADAEDHWADDDFPFEVLGEFGTGRGDKGLSCFEVSGTEDLEMLGRIAAALYLSATSQSELRQAQFRFISTERLTDLGISFKQTKGKVEDDELSNRHYDIVGLRGPTAVSLAREFCAGATANLGAPAVAEAIAKGVVSSRFSLEKLTKDGLSHLRKHGFIKILAEVTPSDAPVAP